jgi:hypothetical protein
VAADDRIEPPGRGCAAPEADSRLRSVFLQHRLIASMRAVPGVTVPTCKRIVERIVERLLAVAGGMEPLVLLEREAAWLARGTAVAVLAVRVARAAGWPPAHLADIGVAGLLADLGELVDAEDAARAGCRWLLERGSEDVWLRSALVARGLRPDAGSTEGAAGACAVVAVVRRAAALLAAADAGIALEDIAGHVRAQRLDVPAELLDVVPAALALA